jgi:hypothetical protein
MVNLVVAIILAFAIALVLIYFISAHDRSRARAEAQAALNSDTAAEVPTMDFREFQKLCQDILEGLKLEIKDVSTSSGGEIVMRATSQNPITTVEYLAVGFHLPRSAELETARIIEISDQIVSERLGKGIIMTTGKINIAAIQALPEIASLSLIDGDHLTMLKKEYSFKY